MICHQHGYAAGTLGSGTRLCLAWYQRTSYNRIVTEFSHPVAEWYIKVVACVFRSDADERVRQKLNVDNVLRSHAVTDGE